jgi:hypothetical protein
MRDLTEYSVSLFLCRLAQNNLFWIEVIGDSFKRDFRFVGFYIVKSIKENAIEFLKRHSYFKSTKNLVRKKLFLIQLRDLDNL